MAECRKQEARDRANLWYLNNSERQKENSFWNTTKRRYGISKEEWHTMFLLQDGCCAICNTHQSKLKVRLHVDHDHSTGKVRQLLCNNCNGGLGMLKDDLNLLLNAVEYLRRHTVE